jgi:putative transposase
MGINAVCRLLGISKKSSYASRSPEDRLRGRHERLRQMIRDVVEQHPGYGYRRIQVALAEVNKVRVNHKLLKKLLSLWGLQLQRRIRPPSRSVVRRLLDYLGRRANLLFRLQSSRCLQVLVSDVTEILYCGGKAYLAVHLDEFGKMIWRWRRSASSSVSLVLDSFHRAIQKIRSVAGKLQGLVVHQDRGSVYTSDAYVRTVSSRGCLLSFSWRGEPGDNAVNEAFFSRLKVEWADVFYEAQTYEELERLVGNAIAYYNEGRYHSSFGYRTPLAFLNDFLTSHQQPVQAVS